MVVKKVKKVEIIENGIFKDGLNKKSNRTLRWKSQTSKSMI